MYFSSDDLVKLDIIDYASAINEIDPNIEPGDIEYGDDYVNADYFRQGSCQLFAYALSTLDDHYQVRKIGADSKDGFHVFCMYDGYYIDVRGATCDFSEFSKGLLFQYSTDRSVPYIFEENDFAGRSDIGIAFAKALIYSDPKRYLFKL